MIINDDKKLSSIIQKIGQSKTIGFDTETVSLEDKTMVAFSFSLLSCNTSQIETYVVPCSMSSITNLSQDGQKRLLNAITDHTGVVLHNYSFDARVLFLAGYKLKHLPHDTLIISHLLNENESHKLKELVKKYCKYTMLTYKEVCGTGKKWISFADLTDESIIDEYAGDDAKFTLYLFNILYPKLLKNKDLKECYENIERPLLKVVADMHNHGVPIQKHQIQQIELFCRGKKDKYKEKLEYYMNDVNINSSKQLREYFIDKKYAPILKKSKISGKASVDSEVLEKYSPKYSEAGWILKYRYYSKILSTFIPALTPENEFIYPSFHQCGTTSGRFSSSEPNFQNIPNEDKLGIRKCVASTKGTVFIGADYSQMELRLAAHYSGDKSMINAYVKGTDIHQLTADAVGCTRRQAKIINFGILYGIGVNSLAKNLESTRAEASTYIKEYYNKYPDIQLFMRNSRKEAYEKGYLKLWGGRHRNISPNFNHKTNWEQSGELRSMTNAIIQGSGAMIIKKAMVLMYPKLKKYNATIIAQIHDELIIECPEQYADEVKEIVKKNMLEPTKGMAVPFEVDVKVGKTWEEIH